MKIIGAVSQQSKEPIDRKSTNCSLILFFKRPMPNTKIIELLRDSLPTCFSSYQKVYNRSALPLHPAFAFDGIVERFYLYRKLIDFWAQKVSVGMSDMSAQQLA